MTDYQKTLNLPKTDFSMKAGLVQKEPAFLEKWENEGLYQKIRTQSKGKTPFVLHDGPPYANGNIHIGHALNKILKDMIIKFRTMQGHDCEYIPGWDCHGLPIEHQLLKEMKKHKSQVDCVEFRKKAHEYAMKFVATQREQFKRLGIFGEWEKPYLTLDPEYEYWILKSLSNLHGKGYVYRGLKPVNWCAQCETALAEAEVEYEDHTSPSVYVEFAVTNKEVLGSLPDKPVALLIWTTTPWTLLANVAVAVHPACQYVLVDVGNRIVIIEKTLSALVLGKGGVSQYSCIRDVKGKELTGLLYAHPFGILDACQVVAAEYVTIEDGTGLVHTAPGHGQDDYATGLKYNLPVVMPVDDRGIYTEKAGAYAGQHVFKANGQIIEDLKNKGVLFATENIAHSYPHCWRCKQPIIFRATQQWFLKIDHNNLRGKLVEAVKHAVKWIPPAGEERILGMITLRPDWCLSRQRYWGVPIPAVSCAGCGGEHKLFGAVVDHVADIVRREGSDAWFERGIADLLPKGFRCPDCGGTDLQKTHDILDVWFDSGVSHQAVVKARMGMQLPIDLYLEGSDQHRGWFQSSIIPAVAMEGTPPYKSILTHGFVVDGQGRKMSKSLGNVVSPLDLMKNSGADIIRLWVAASSYTEDIRISQEIIDRLVDAYRKIRNTMRYLLGNLDGFDPDTDVCAYEQLVSLDKWALSRLATAVTSITDAYEHYEFARAYKGIYAFCNEDLSSFYLDILKDRLYTSATQSQERRSAQTVLFHITDHLVRVMAPILCFTAEEIFLAMPKAAKTRSVTSVHLLTAEPLSAQWQNNGAIEKEFELMVAIRPAVLKALEDKRREGIIGSSLEAKLTIETASERDFSYFSQWQRILPSVFIVSQVTLRRVATVTAALSDMFSQTAVIVEKADGEKCSRCWNYTTDVGSNPQHSTLCARCVSIVKEIV